MDLSTAFVCGCGITALLITIGSIILEMKSDEAYLDNLSFIACCWITLYANADLLHFANSAEKISVIFCFALIIIIIAKVFNRRDAELHEFT